MKTGAYAPVFLVFNSLLRLPLSGKILMSQNINRSVFNTFPHVLLLQFKQLTCNKI